MTEPLPDGPTDVAIEIPPICELLGGFGFRFKIHESTERYGRSHEDLVKCAGPGERRDFHGEPYQLIGDHHLKVGLLAVPPPSGEIGTLEDVRWEGYKHQDMTAPRADTTPREDRYRGGPPWEDTLNLIIWQFRERFLIDDS